MNTLRILDRDAARVEALLFARTDVESAAYLRCAIVRHGVDVTFLVREVTGVADEHYLVRERDRLSIASDSFIPILKQVRATDDAFVFIHTHPDGPRAFSEQDDAEEDRLFTTVRQRAPGRLHLSLVFTDASSFVGRVHGTDSAVTSLDRIVVVGRRFRMFLGTPDTTPLPVFFDRQVRAFGPEIQRLLRHLRIAIVGGGGTGSPTFEQCLRLGAGEILVIDYDTFDPSNVNRVYNSRRTDAGKPKIEIIERTAADADLPTVARTIRGSINDPSIARELLWADVIFGCTDKELPRAILCRLATRYLIPVFDMGVVITSTDGVVKGVTGRVTTVFPGTSCLICRERISPAMIRAESLSPDERRQLAAEGYAPELNISNPAVIPFTTSVASHAVSELLHRLTGFMGERTSTETLIQFDVPQMRSNATSAEPWCDCANENVWGRGDEMPFLGMAWPEQSEEAIPSRAMRQLLRRTAESILRVACSVAPWLVRRRLRRTRYGSTFVIPRNDERRERLASAGHPVVEEKAERSVWLSIRCPCRCGTVLRLNLMRSQRPAWTALVDARARLTVSPSVDVPACGSHFWIRDGRVDWV